MAEATARLQDDPFGYLAVLNPFVSSTRTRPKPTRHPGRVVEASTCTCYAVVDGTHIAYHVIGQGPFDLLHTPGLVSNVELAWEQPSFAHFLERLASFSRLIIFDKRGAGMSDRVPSDRLPTLEERMDDVRAVLDAAGSERVALFSHSEGGNLMEELERDWGGTSWLEHLVPSCVNDEAFRRQLATYFRRSASPGAAAALIKADRRAADTVRASLRSDVARRMHAASS